MSNVLFMKCREIKYRLVEYLDNSLPEAEKLILKNHLSECADCNSYFRFYSTLNSGNFRKELPFEPNPFFYTRLLSKIETRNKSTLLPVLKPYLAIAGLAIAIFAGVLIGNRKNVDTQKTNAASEQIQYLTFADNQNFEQEYLNLITKNE